MLFNSLTFIFAFLPISLLGYFGLNRYRLALAAKAWLVLCSLFFYSWWNPAYLPLILGSMLVNYAMGTALTQATGRRPKVSPRVLLTLGVVFNLGLLGYFKYANFFVENLNHLGWQLDSPDVLLPLAISFFTFQQIAYLVDSYRQETHEYDFLNYALFVTFFPQLIAGPIVHHKEMMPQFASAYQRVARYRHIALGLFVFSIGLFKKVVIADTFAQWATPGFESSVPLPLLEAWITSLSYTFQLYFDFSGYTDMAIGAALLFNIQLPINFNSPYKALSIQDFWRRWHITLSRFLRDYLYIPLGGNRFGTWRTYSNLFITFLLGGLWHGASWMFVIWGALHGGALVVHRLWQRWGGALPTVLAWVVTFQFINLTWVFFRAEDMQAALNVLSGMVGLNGGLPGSLSAIPTSHLAWLGTLPDHLPVWGTALAVHSLPLLAMVGAFWLISLNNTATLMRQRLTALRMAGAAVLFACALYMSLAGASSVFLYFNF